MRDASNTLFYYIQKELIKKVRYRYMKIAKRASFKKSPRNWKELGQDRIGIDW